MEIRLAAYLQPDSIVDGEGIRTVIWTQGCTHNCPGCHNPGTHDFNLGFSQTLEEIKEEISLLEGQDGITLSGGDPMFQPEACIEIAKYAKSLNLNVWCYTGFTFEQLKALSKSKSVILELLNEIDVLIDGKFILENKSLNLLFRGSSNQRVIDVKKSLEEGTVCTLKKYDEKQESYLFGKAEYMFI